MPFANYDEQIRGILPNYDLFHQEIISLVKAMPSKPRVWLDTGCGTGTLVERAFKYFPDTKFLLADPSWKMLEEAKKKLSGSNGIIFLEPTCTQELPADVIGSPDIITAVQSHHYLSKEDRIKATKVCYDLLSEAGIYVTFENIRPMTDMGIEIGKRNWRNYQLSMGRKPEVVESHLARFDAAFFPITIEEHFSLMKGRGFKVVELLWYSCMQAGFYCVK